MIATEISFSLFFLLSDYLRKKWNEGYFIFHGTQTTTVHFTILIFWYFLHFSLSLSVYLFWRVSISAEVSCSLQKSSKPKRSFAFLFSASYLISKFQLIHEVTVAIEWDSFLRRLLKVTDWLMGEIERRVFA